MSNKLLHTGKIAFTISEFILYLIAFVSLAIGIYLITNSEEPLPSWLSLSENRVLLSTESRNDLIYPPAIGIIIFNLIKIEGLIAISIIIIRQIKRVIESVNKKEAFALHNKIRFKNIGTLFVLVFFINLLNIKGDELGGITLKLDFEPIFLLYSILAFILAEVFSEGHKMYEENKLTI